MAIATKPRPPFWRRVARNFGIAWGITPIDAPMRSAWLEGGDWQHHDSLVDLLAGSPEARRFNRSNADMSAIYGAVFAAVRRRSRGAMKPRIALMRKLRGGELEEVPEHPALDALHRVNESLTFRQGMGLIEQHKLTYGKAYWIKRRNGLGVPVEFEIWPPDEVKVIPDATKPWVPAAFERRMDGGMRVERVKPIDVVWFRHLVDPRNHLNGLSPIGAIRMQLDTGLEAQRYNQRFFDNSTHLGQMFTAEDVGEGELARLREELERNFKGTDRAHSSMVTGGNLKLVEPTISHRDMEFMAQQRWTVEEVARVFELAPTLIGDTSQATKENVSQYESDFWSMMVDQVTLTFDEFTEFYLWPDFGEEFIFMPRFDDVAALQEDLERRARIDALYLKNGKVVINELRDRDSQEAVAWGDLPIMPSNMAPLGSIMAAPPEDAPSPPEPPRSAFARNLDDLEATMTDGWERRLGKELTALLKHLKEAATRNYKTGVEDKEPPVKPQPPPPPPPRALEDSDVDSFDWDWWTRHGAAVAAEIEVEYLAILADAGFVPTPLMDAQELAVRYARRRSAELLRLDGRENVVAETRRVVKKLVAETIANGDSLNTLEKRLREHYAFSRSRAETIARTETAKAIGDGTLKSYQSMGVEGKEWLLAGPDADAGDRFGPCQIAAAQGAVPLLYPFSNGFDAPPAHPRCRCRVIAVAHLPVRSDR